MKRIKDSKLCFQNEDDVISINDSSSDDEDFEQEDNDDDDDDDVVQENSSSSPSFSSSNFDENKLQIDEQSNSESQEPNLQELENVEVAKEFQPKIEENKSVYSAPEGSTTDPFNQAVASISMLTEDNSGMSNDPYTCGTKMESSVVEGSTNDPLNQAAISIMTDDNSMNESNIDLNYSDEEEVIGKTGE